MDEMVDSAEKIYSVFSSEEAAETTVKLLKLSEAAESTMGIKSIDVTSVGDIQPTAEKELKIEFIGDSITEGILIDPDQHYDDAAPSVDDRALQDDSTASYAWLTAQALGMRPVIMGYRVLFSLITFVGATTTLEIVWNFSDTMNGLMIIPNLICLIWLNKDIADECFEYEREVVVHEKNGEVIDYAQKTA